MKYQTKADSLLKSMFQRLAPIAAMVCCTLLLQSCYSEGKDSYSNIKKIFPNSRVFKNPKNTFIFYVVDSISVKRVTTLNWSDDNIDSIEELVEIK